MRYILLFLAFFLILPSSVNAEPKPWYWSWWPSHWENQDFRPHLMDPKTPHNAQWHARWNPSNGWTPEDWIAAEGSVDAVLKNLYDAEIIKEQTEDDDIPLLIVGDGFMHLSGQEKRRVVDFIDYGFQVTARPENAFFYIYYDRTKRLWSRGDPIGVYTETGLQLQ